MFHYRNARCGNGTLSTTVSKREKMEGTVVERTYAPTKACSGAEVLCYLKVVFPSLVPAAALGSCVHDATAKCVGKVTILNANVVDIAVFPHAAYRIDPAAGKPLSRWIEVAGMRINMFTAVFEVMRVDEQADCGVTPLFTVECAFDTPWAEGGTIVRDVDGAEVATVLERQFHTLGNNKAWYTMKCVRELVVGERLSLD